MAHLVYPSFLRKLRDKSIDLTRDRFAVMLAGDYSPDRSHETRSEVADEIEADGYTSGGLPLDTSGSGMNALQAAPAAWANASILAGQAVVYVARGGPETDDLVCCFELPDWESRDDAYRLTWEDDCILEVT